MYVYRYMFLEKENTLKKCINGKWKVEGVICSNSR